MFPEREQKRKISFQSNLIRPHIIYRKHWLHQRDEQSRVTDLSWEKYSTHLIGYALFHLPITAKHNYTMYETWRRKRAQMRHSLGTYFCACVGGRFLWATPVLQFSGKSLVFKISTHASPPPPQLPTLLFCLEEKQMKNCYNQSKHRRCLWGEILTN